MAIESWVINNHLVEFLEDEHIYLVDGIITNSVTQILSTKYNDYDKVPKSWLDNAGKLGTAMHKAIELFETTGREDDSIELRNYKFLKAHYKWTNIANEVPIIYEQDGKVLFAGRLDQVIEIDGVFGINDFKRVSAPNKEKICYQLNLYKLGYEQSYNKQIDFLTYTQLRENVRKFIKLPVAEEQTLALLADYYSKGV